MGNYYFNTIRTKTNKEFEPNLNAPNNYDNYYQDCLHELNNALKNEAQHISYSEDERGIYVKDTIIPSLDNGPMPIIVANMSFDLITDEVIPALGTRHYMKEYKTLGVEEVAQILKELEEYNEDGIEKYCSALIELLVFVKRANLIMDKIDQKLEQEKAIIRERENVASKYIENFQVRARKRIAENMKD